jgi:hypothetical protein
MAMLARDIWVAASVTSFKQPKKPKTDSSETV